MIRESAQTQADDWNVHWGQFAKCASENPAQHYRHRLLVWLLEPIAKASPMRLLDLGSGQGDFLAKANEVWPAAELAGLEMSEVGVLMTRKKVPRARVFAADLFAFQPEVAPLEGWANAAVCSEVLEHVDSPVAFLRAASQYLTEGSTLVVTVPGGPLSAFDRHIGHRQHFTRASIRRVLESAGFEIERVALAGFPFFNLYRMLVIARGERLTRDMTTESQGLSFLLLRCAMAVFRILFRANLFDTHFGWQVVAVAHKASK
jgi:trans-aconitate methyltransferase